MENRSQKKTDRKKKISRRGTKWTDIIDDSLKSEMNSSILNI